MTDERQAELAKWIDAGFNLTAKEQKELFTAYKDLKATNENAWKMVAIQEALIQKHVATVGCIGDAEESARQEMGAKLT